MEQQREGDCAERHLGFPIPKLCNKRKKAQMFIALLGGKPRKKESKGEKREEVGSQTRSWGRTRSQTDYDVSSFAPSSLVQLVSVLA